MRAMLGLAVLCFPIGSGDSFASDALDLFSKCEEYRIDHFDAGHAELRIVRSDSTRDIAPDNAGEEIEIWFDGDLLRNDVQAPPNSVQVVLTPDRYIWNLDPEVDVLVAPSKEYDDPQKEFFVTHPRWIGMGSNHPARMAQGRPFRCLLFDKALLEKHASVTEETIGSVNLAKITVSLKVQVPEELPPGVEPSEINAENATENGISLVDVRVTKIYWIAPSQGYALVKYEDRSEFPSKETTQVSEVNSSYVQDEVSGVWYAKKTNVAFYVNGKKREESHYFVDSISFEPPSADVFTIEGLGLPANRRVSDRSKGKREVCGFWDGKKLVEIPHPADGYVYARPDGTHGFSLFLGGIALAGLGLWVFIAVGRRERHGKSQ